MAVSGYGVEIETALPAAWRWRTTDAHVNDSRESGSETRIGFHETDGDD